MSWGSLRVLAVVPARGGSKGIPRKNLATVGGLTLVAHAARVISDCDWIDYALLSTDDDEIAEEGRRIGLAVPFIRPAELAADSSPAAPTWRHAWLEAERATNRTFDVSVLVQPTSPLRTAEDLRRCAEPVCEGRHAAATTVSPTPAHFTPHKTFVITEGGRLRPFLDPALSRSTRQEIPPHYTRNGLCYAVVRDALVERLHITEEDCAAVLIDRPIVNIDEPFDLEMAEWLHRREQTKAADLTESHT